MVPCSERTPAQRSFDLEDLTVCARCWNTQALAGALDLITGAGGGRVEGYPEDAALVPAGFLFHGALSTYEQLGFVRERMIGKHRWVVSKVVEAS